VDVSVSSSAPQTCVVVVVVGTVVGTIIVTGSGAVVSSVRSGENGL